MNTPNAAPPPPPPRTPACEGCTARLTQVRQLQVSLADQAHALREERARERQLDLQTWQDNLSRMLEEKARLIEEVEMMQNQKDGITEALVRAHQQLDEQARVHEERDMYQRQHGAASVELLQRNAELKLTRQELRVSRDAATAATQAGVDLGRQLETARSVLASTTAAQATIRADAEAARTEGSASDAARLSAESSAARTAAELRLITSVVAEGETALQAARYAVPADNMFTSQRPPPHQDSASTAPSGIPPPYILLTPSAPLTTKPSSPLASSEREAAVRLRGRAETDVWSATLSLCEADLIQQGGELQTSSEQAVEHGRRVRESEVAAGESERRGRAASNETAKLGEEMLLLRGEREAAVAELKAAKKLVESLKSELRKAVVQGHRI